MQGRAPVPALFSPSFPRSAWERHDDRGSHAEHGNQRPNQILLVEVNMPEDHLDVDGLQKLLWSFASHRVVTVASRVGLLRRLAQAETTPDQAAEELGLDPLATGKLMRALTALGLLEASGSAYRAVEPLRPHFLPGPDELSPFVDHLHELYDRWGATLEGWVRGEPPPSRQRSPEATRRFGEAMQAMGAHVSKQVASSLDLDGVERVLDVGGGFGHYAKALCRVNPDLTATVLDHPEVAAIGRAGTEFEGRIDFVGGDYLEDDYGTGYDLVLLANVLHQEPAEQAAGLVRKAAASLAPGGRVAVVDFSIDDEQRDHVFGALFAINMKSFGDTYPEPVIRRWMEEAGLIEVVRTDLSDYRWLITGRRLIQP